MVIDPFRFLLAALAVYRLSFMAAQEEGPFRIAWAWRELWIVRKPNSWITRGFQCIMCISFWVGFSGAAMLVTNNFWLDFVMVGLALSGITVLLKLYLPGRY